jgi:D-alanyl-lipoteichoic acid acyltransferase DltB (MBOAT superfamily)
VLFNSFAFVCFFATVTTLFFLLPHRFRWLLLLLASCFFYMFFVPIYILILFVTIVIDYFAGIWIERADDPRRKRLLLSVSVISVCATLFIFKYFNFFNANFAALAKHLHWSYPIAALRIALPIGLSFHTFQSLSYVIEVYRGKQKAERHFGIYALYVMYFPQLVAGPIERPQNLLHQFHEPKRFDLPRLQSGLTLALWGLFKKVVVADSLAIYTDTIYGASSHHTNSTLLLATYCFAFQIYCDFSAYSDMARGISRAYGIELMKNFDAPYFSQSISEFWTRWHISLSTWFKDYVYFPLGGNRVSLLRNCWNLYVVFLLSGFWHGANWTFIVWGLLHGTFLVAERLRNFVRQRFAMAVRRDKGPVRQAWSMLVTFHLVLFAWVFFRASDVETGMSIARRILMPRGGLFWDPVLVQGALGVLAVLIGDYFIRRTDYFDNLDRYPLGVRWAFALTTLSGIALLGVEQGAQFIYFQF